MRYAEAMHNAPHPVHSSALLLHAKELTASQPSAGSRPGLWHTALYFGLLHEDHCRVNYNSQILNYRLCLLCRIIGPRGRLYDPLLVKGQLKPRVTTEFLTFYRNNTLFGLA